MDYVYFLGDEKVKQHIIRSLSLIGYKVQLKDNFKFKDEDNSRLVIYSLNIDLEPYVNNIRNYPKNVILLSKSKENNTYMEPNIFLYRNDNFTSSFSTYIIKLIKKNKIIEDNTYTQDNDFFVGEEEVYMYYLVNNPHLSKDFICGKYSCRVENLDLNRISIPGKYFLFITGNEKEIDFIKDNYNVLENIVLVAFRCKNKIKKELKRLSFLIPIIFINNLNNRIFKKIIKNFYL